jgi:3-hydroxybutyryl-CoA dehydrogenase
MTETPSLPGLARIGVVGAGTIGTQLAAYLTKAGLEVVALDEGDDLAALAGLDLVIEAVPERLAEKMTVLAGIAEVVGPETLLATTTSALSVTELGTGIAAPGRFAALVFHTPVADTLTVEVAPGLQTDAATVERLVELVQTLPGKQALVVEDRPGFLLGALLMPYLNDVIGAYDEDLASAEDLDVALELGLGYRTGPLAVLDRIGLDTHLDATTAAHDATGDPRYAPPPLLRRMVAAGRLGDKTTNGFRAGKDNQ